MKKIYMLLGLGITSLGLFAFNNSNTFSDYRTVIAKHQFSGGGQTGLTGAPGESNCTQCHTGDVQSGNTENALVVLDAGLNPVTTYIPGQSYTVTLTMTSDPAKKGFSSVALDATDNQAGSFTGSGIGGTQDFLGGVRHYVSHTSSGNTSATTAWGWTWVAPATDVGDITFYVASNAANNDGSTFGDVIYLSNQTLTIDPSIGVADESVDLDLQVGYNSDDHKITLDFASLSSGDMHFNLVDMNGKSAYTSDLGDAQEGENSESIQLPAHLKNGSYIVHFFVDNKAYSSPIAIQR